MWEGKEMPKMVKVGLRRILAEEAAAEATT